MKRFVWIIFLFCILTKGISQDIIKTKTGEEFKAKLLKLTRKEATYKIYEDPEFSTYTLPYKELTSIQKQGEKKPVLFNHRLPRGYIGFSMAFPTSIPLGSFAINDFSNAKNEPGFAKKGFNAKFDVAFYIVKRLGLTIGAGYYSNNFNYSKYADAYNGDNSTGQNFSAQSNSYFDQQSNDKGNKEAWIFRYLMVGPIYSFKISKRITWDFKARMGPMSVVRPEVFLSYHGIAGTVSDSAFFTYKRSEKTQLSYNLGTSIRVSLSKRIAFLLAADYMHTSPALNIEVDQYGSTIPQSVSGYKVKYSISSLNLSLGFAYQFKRKGNKFE